MVVCHGSDRAFFPSQHCLLKVLEKFILELRLLVIHIPERLSVSS